MHWPRTFNQVELNEDLFLWESPQRDATTCVLLCHGGLVPGIAPHWLPAGMTVRYWVPHGERFRTNVRRSIYGSAGATRIYTVDGVLNHYAGHPAVAPPQSPGHEVTGPAFIDNSLVRKVLGRHSDTKRPQDATDILLAMDRAWRQTLRQGLASCPHVISVRHRRHRGGACLLLGDVIDVVKRARPAINEIHFAGCRSVLSFEEWRTIPPPWHMRPF